MRSMGLASLFKDNGPGLAEGCTENRGKFATPCLQVRWLYRCNVKYFLRLRGSYYSTFETFVVIGPFKNLGLVS